MHGKDFSFEKGRYLLLNWYIHHIQQQQSTYHDDDASISSQHMFLMDPEEGNKTHAYLQLEGLIHLDSSHLTVGSIKKKLMYFFYINLTCV